MTERPRINSVEYALLNPTRPAVHRVHSPASRRNPRYPWEVWIGPRWHSSHPTHASAITSATYWARVLARAPSGTVWTTPDSGTQADYGLATGSA